MSAPLQGVPLADFDGHPVGFSDSDEAIASLCHARGIWLRQVSSCTWLVRNTEETIGREGVIACIDEHDDGFELMEVGDEFRWSTFPTLGDAVMHIEQQPS